MAFKAHIMAVISLEDVRFYAYHGFYEEEQTLGTEYVIDISVDVVIDEAAEEDDLFQTVNYETLFLLCQAEMRTPSRLIEAVAQRIVNRVEDHFGDKIRGVKLKLRKLNPPLGGRVGAAAIEIVTGVFDLPTLRTLRILRRLSANLNELKE